MKYYFYCNTVQPFCQEHSSSSSYYYYYYYYYIWGCMTLSTL